MRRLRMGALAAGIATLAVISSPALADTTTVVGQSGDGGWTFNPDPVNATPYEFTTDEASIGNGSLHVFPITNTTNAQKFIGALDVGGTQIADFDGFSFDFLIENTGPNVNPTAQFYINVYTNLPASATFYDCRFDYVATAGSETSFSTLAIDGATAPTAKGDRAGDGFTCPATLAGMPAGSTISVIAVNVGDTSGNDTGVGGYLDNAQLSVDGDTTTYDFDVDDDHDGVSDTAPPTDKDQCKKGGYASFNNPSFPNQGLCVSYVNGRR